MVNSLNMELYPNPVENELTLTINAENQNYYRVTIMDASGKVVSKNSYAEFNNSRYKMNVSQLIPGSYFIYVADEVGQFLVLKFVKH